MTNHSKKIWINHDLTAKEREAEKALRDELRSRRDAGEANLVIRRGRIVTLPPKPVVDLNQTGPSSRDWQSGQNKCTYVNSNKAHNDNVECENLCPSSRNSTFQFPIFYSNVDSFLNKKEEIETFIDDHKPKIICFTEIIAKNQKDVNMAEYTIQCRTPRM